MELQLNVYYTIAIAVAILLVGESIKKRSKLLQKFCIPVPVIGGLLFTICLTAGVVSGSFKLVLDTSFNEFFSFCFCFVFCF